MDTTSSKLKAEGNELFKKGKFEEAVSKYSEALEHDPENAALYSNRSLSYIKLKNFQKALEDANECICKDPKWIKGYVRRTLAYQGLGNHAKVMESAEEAFKISGDAKVKTELVQHWLTANQILHALPEGSIELPQGIFIISKKYMETLVCLVQSLNGEKPLSNDLTEHCLSTCARDIESILKLFGEPTSSVVHDWAKFLPNEVYPDYINSEQKREIKAQTNARTASMVEFINNEIDPALYPILRPMFGLVVLIVLNRCNILTKCNSSHHSTELMNEALLPLFESSLLSHEDYYNMYIGRICAVLDSYVGRGTTPTKEEAMDINSTCQKLRKAIKNYPPHLPDLTKDSEMAERILFNIQQNVLSPLRVFKPIVHVRSVMTVEVAESLVSKKPDEVKTYITNHLKVLESAQFLSMGEVEELLTMTGIFHKLQDHKQALKVFQKGEKAFFTVFERLLSSHILTLEQCSATISQMRQHVLNQALLFITSNIFPDIVLRWKCLFSEIRLQLIRRSSGKLFEPFFNWYSTQITTSKAIQPEEVYSSLGQHVKREEELLKVEAKVVLQEHSRLSYSALQDVLDDDVVVVDYVFFSSLEDIGNAYCVICQKKEKPLVCKLDFHLVRRQTAKVFNLLSKGSSSYGLFKRELIALAQYIIPQSLLDIFSMEKIKRVFFCPDLGIATIPLDLLPVSFGTNIEVPLYEILSVSQITSMRQIISHQHSFPPSNKTCCVIGAPNFNLKRGSQAQSMFEKLVGAFCDYLSVSPSTGPIVEPLDHSQSEADFVAFSLHNAGYDVLELTGDNATFSKAMSLQSPVVLHVSSHASGQTKATAFRGNFFSDLTCSIALAGFNTLSRQHFELLPSECGPAQLPPLAIYSMNLKGTKLVFLSTCNSAIGEFPVNEAVNSLANAFIVAGVETVIGTLTTVPDETASIFTKYFYDKLVQPGVRPSQAIAYAKLQMFLSSCSDDSWVCPASFVCYGIDNPL